MAAEAALNSETLALESGQGNGHAARGDGDGRSQRAHAEGTAAVQQAPHRPQGGDLLLRRIVVGIGSRAGVNEPFRMQRFGQAERFRGAPALGAVEQQHVSPPSRLELLEQGPPLGSGRGGDQSSEQVVQLIGVPRVRGDLGFHPFDGAQMEAADLLERHWQAPAQRNGPSATVRRLAIVEEGKGFADQDFMAHR